MTTPSRFCVWRSAKEAKALGATNYGRFCGLIPGFLADDGAGGVLWIPRSDLFAPLEDLLASMWVALREMRGDAPDFAFSVGREIGDE